MFSKGMTFLLIFKVILQKRKRVMVFLQKQVVSLHLEKQFVMQNPPDYRHDTVLPLPMEVTADAWAVDAGCSGNPGPMEYQCIDLATGERVFHFGPMKGTNNIGEFLAIVHALALCWQRGLHNKTIYSDSYNAILWVQKRKCKTKLEHTTETEHLYNILFRAEQWLLTHDYHNPIIKWETSKWGEIPADFGRKK